jgi:hypothetical protein
MRRIPLGLLRTRRERPRRRCAAKKSDELAPFHAAIALSFRSMPMRLRP